MADVNLSVSTFNSYYKQNDNTLDELDGASKKADIIGTQEVTPNGVANQADTLLDTHTPYVGEGYGEGGGYNGEFSPIYYNSDRFNLVEGNHLRLHDKNYDGVEGPGRVANSVLLQDKETNGTVLAVNAHLANGNWKAQQLGEDKIADHIQKMKEKYNVDSTVVMGDFNTNRPHIDGMSKGEVPEGSPTTWEGGANLDHILVGKNMKADRNYEVTDGGESDHNIVSRNMSFETDGNKTYAPSQDSKGGIMYEDQNYGGDKWLFGFGSPGPKNDKWNDEITSIRLGEGTEATLVHKHSQNDSRFGGPDDAERKITGDIPNLGDEWNDQISNIQW